MASQSSLQKNVSAYSLFAIVVAIGGVTLPLVFGRTITISPLVLFLAAIVPNLLFLKTHKDGENNGSTDSIGFLKRVAVSAICAFAIFGIYHTAYIFAG